MMLTFYDLVSKPDGALWSPNTWKVRLSLLHKAQHQPVQFQTRDLTLFELRGEMVKRTGLSRPRAPALELDDTFLFDSFVIAQYLDSSYPVGPPLILDENAAYLLDQGFGNSDSGWSTMFELCAVAIADTMTEKEREYFTSDAKLGFTDGWAKITEQDQASLLKRAQDSLLPFESLLSRRPMTNYLTSHADPGFIDYVVFGRYAMIAYTRPDLVEDLWMKGKLGEWVKRMIERFDLQELMARTG